MDGLAPMTEGIVPIADDERWRRIEKAQRLMAAGGMQAIFLDVGTSLEYFTGVKMWPSAFSASSGWIEFGKARARYNGL